MADWAVENVPSLRTAVFFENDPSGQATSTAFIERFTDAGGTILGEYPFSQALPTFEPFIAQIESLGGTDGVLVAGYSNKTAELLAALESRGGRPIVLADVNPPQLSQMVLYPGNLFTTSKYSPYTNTEKNTSFVTSYRRRHDGDLPDLAAASGYDAVLLIAQAVLDVGSDRKRIRDYLVALDSTTESFIGLTGPIVFDAQGDLRNGEINVVPWRGEF